MNKILPALVAALLASTASIATAKEESWPGTPSIAEPTTPGTIVDSDSDGTDIIQDDDEDDDGDDEEDTDDDDL